MSIVRDSKLYFCLYANEDGVIEDLYEAQLIEEIPKDRIPVLYEALKSSELYTVYQSTLLLSAWADPKGLERLEAFVDTPPDYVLDPDNVNNHDRTLDVLATALSISLRNGNSIDNIFRVYKKLLKYYPYRIFKGEFVHALEKIADKSILQEIIQALKDTKRTYMYQSSSLLPTIAKLDPEKGWELSQQFMKYDGEKPNPVANVGKALLYIDTKESKSLLKKLNDHSDSYVVSSIERMKEQHAHRDKLKKIRGCLD